MRRTRRCWLVFMLVFLMCLVACGKTQNDVNTENNGENEGKSGMDILIDEQGIERPSMETVDALKEKRALFVGDSIMAGVCDYNNIFGISSWPGRIGYFCDMAVTNNGVSGACISNIQEMESSEYYIYNQLNKENGQAYDYVIMHGLHNDWGNGAKIGTPMGMANFQPENADVSTFSGALELLLYTAKTNHPDAKCGYIINYKTGEQLTYVDTIKQICDDWNVPYLNLYDNRTFQIDLYDGLHPTSTGYNKTYIVIADWMARELK